MIIFKNKGVIDLRAIKTFGVSVKKENAIGFFGTGLKYAIAILLREGCGISVYSGGIENKFSVKNIQVTGQDFDIVCMNDEELGFTTELGKEWRLWQAMREIYCNCTDEGGTIQESEDFACGPDETVIVVSGTEFTDLFRNIGAFILQDKPSIENKFIAIRKRPSHAIYYKGVLVKDDLSHGIYTYDLKSKITLTEDRTAKYNHELAQAVCQGVALLDDEEVIENIITAQALTFEGQLEFSYAYMAPSETFANVAKRLAENHHPNTNKSAIEYAKKYGSINEEPIEYKPSVLETKMLERAQELLMISGFLVNKYPMIIVETLGTGTLAQVRTGKMYISRACFSKGTKLLAHALLEEHFHIETGHKDETRAFQTFLFDNILTLIERLNQEAF